MRILPALTALSLACAHTAPVLRSRGLTEAVSTTDALREALAPRRVALLVGIDTYDDPAFEDLHHAVDDAEAVAALLRRKESGFDEVVVLAGAEGTTRTALFDAIRRTAAGLRRDDELVVYFAGHGVRAEVGGSRRFLLPSDASTIDLVGTAIDVDAFVGFLTSLAPLRTGIIVDACFDGGGRSARPPAGPGQPAAPIEDRRTAELGPGDIQVYATTPGRPSLEDDTVGHGVYSWYLLEAMSWGFREADADRDGLLTLWEAHDHARGRVVTHTSGAQVPEAILRTVGEADVVLVGSSTVREARESALLYLYVADDHPLHGATLRIDGRARGALPGTIPVEPGRHAVTVIDSGGVVVADGYIEVGEGRAYRVDGLVTKVQQERGDVAVRVVGLAHPGLGDALGAGGGGLEVSVTRRLAPRVAPGLVLGGRAVIGTSVGVAGGLGARPVLTGGLALGWQGDKNHLQWRVGWTASAWWIPARDAGALSDPLDDPDRAGWAFFGTGPQVVLGGVVGRGWSVDATVLLEGTGVQTSASTPPAFVPLLTLGIGARAAF